jgi:diguanylate cyclase (GGDEF)-like protein
VKLSDDLRRRCAGLPFTAGKHGFSVTCSLGVSRWAPGDTADDLLKRADIALYQAKAEGRNRVRGTHIQAAPEEFAGIARADSRS